MSTYAIIKTGGKQYRVQQDETLLVERLPVQDGAKVALTPLLFVDGEDLIDGDGLSGVTVEATVLAHERGPKLRIVKFKPKRGYKRRNGHRQELTRIQVTTLGRASGGRRSGRAAKPAPATASASAQAPAATANEEATDGA
jgi:large subunit ribosomal protein L21